MRGLVQAAIQVARQEIVLSTPYFIPDSPTMAAMEVAARRGVRVTLIVPRANDSLLAAWASRASYERLLDAGVELWEYRRGFLHSKTISVDDEMGIVTCVEAAGGLMIDGKSITVRTRATNVFTREGGAWKMIHHHADATLAPVSRR